jgi:hypothetical protein
MLYVWASYPRVSSYPLVAVGEAETEDTARRCVEAALDSPDVAWGVVLCPGGHTEVCRRSLTGFDWRPM